MKRKRINKRGMNPTKFGSIFLVAIMGLAAVGASYAHWQETLTVSGVMTTDDINPVFDCLQSNDDPDSVSIDDRRDPIDCGTWDFIPGAWQWIGGRRDKDVGNTDLSTSNNDQILDVIISDAYPCYYSHISYCIKNIGSCPVLMRDPMQLESLSIQTDPADPATYHSIDIDDVSLLIGIRYYIDIDTSSWTAVVHTDNDPDFTVPADYDFSMIPTGDTRVLEQDFQLDPWDWEHGDTNTVDDHMQNPANYHDQLNCDLCIHFENGCLESVVYDFNIGMTWYNWPEYAGTTPWEDRDRDQVIDELDNCPDCPNTDQLNSDGDTLGDACDNCPTTDNEDQTNSDTDSHGDACDNCPTTDNEDQTDTDGDLVGDVCDNCHVYNPGQENSDSDSHGDACDNCPTVDNEDQANSDADSHGDVCDNCPNDDNENQADNDGDGAGDVCDPDDDNDGVLDVDDCAPLDSTKWQLLTGYVDGDGDGYGAGSSLQVCSGAVLPAGYADDGGDCDDTNAAVYPGATEACNGIDDDCDGETDEEGATDCTTYYYDGDRDNYGNSANSKCLCSPTGLYTATEGGDCYDADNTIHPGATEICDGMDNDCDGLVDDADPDCVGLNTYYHDADGDGYGDPSDSTQACSAPSGYVSDNTDCDDTDPNVNPGEDEVCGNSIDDDCDDEIDEDCDVCSDFFTEDHEDGDDWGKSSGPAWMQSNDGSSTVVDQTNNLDPTSTYIGRLVHGCYVIIGVNTVGKDQVTVSYQSMAQNLDYGETVGFWVSYDGINWNAVVSEGNHDWTQKIYDISAISSGLSNNNPNFMIGFNISANRDNERFFIDNIIVSDCKWQWISPTGYNDPSGTWTSEANAYDENTGTRASSTTSDWYWHNFLELTLDSSITSNKIRYYGGYSGSYFHLDQIDIDVFIGGSWVGVYQGSFTRNTWVEHSFTEGTVTKARIRFGRSDGYASLFTGYLNEFDFWGTP